MGFARLMLPDRPLPVVSSVGFSPLRHDPNAAVAINAANLARGHVTLPLRQIPRTLETAIDLKGPPAGHKSQAGVHPMRRALAQPFRDVQMPRSRRNRSHGADEFMARIR